MNNYYIWYKKSFGSQKCIRGTSRNYLRAEEMAHSLYIIEGSLGGEIYSSGVTRMAHGEIYSDDCGDLSWNVILEGKDVRDEAG